MKTATGVFILAVVLLTAVPAIRARQTEAARAKAAEMARAAAEARRGDYVTAASVALTAVQDIQSVVGGGTIYSDYCTRVADARIAVDRFLRSHPEDLLPPSRKRLEQAIACYELAARDWQRKIVDRADAAMHEAMIQEGWRLASEHITAVEAALAGRPIADSTVK
jgi:hypothetical protein